MSQPPNDPAVLRFQPGLDAIDFKHLRAFVAVADGLNFGRAAERLFVSAPALSRQIRALERAVGCQLFRRSTHQVELTLAGEALLDCAHQVLADLERGVATTRAVGGELDARMSALWSPVVAAEGPDAISERRIALERMLAQFPPPSDVEVLPVNAGGVPALRLSPQDVADDYVLLYLHGGGYVMGSAFGYRATVAALITETRTAAIVPDYRLAPEHPFPAAVDDVFAAYNWLLDTGVPADRIVLAGDSSGCALAALSMIRLRTEQLPLPALAIMLSPWLDLTRTALDGHPDMGAEFGVTVEQVRYYVASYTGDRPLDDPLLSPLHADLAGLPPLLVQTGTGDPLMDDARRIVDHATECGGDARLELYPADTHVFHLFWSFLPAAVDALRSAGEYVNAARAAGGRTRTG